jgi:transcriptional regulator with XRE-family HTH domain
MSNIGGRVKALRKQKGITQQDLGSAVGLTYGAISAIEKGHSENPDTLDAIATYFKVDPLWLRTGEGTAPKGLIIATDNKLKSEDNPWKDALVKQQKEQIDNLLDTIAFLKTLIPRPAQNFLKPLSKAGFSGMLKVHSDEQLGGGLRKVA